MKNCTSWPSFINRMDGRKLRAAIFTQGLAFIGLKFWFQWAGPLNHELLRDMLMTIISSRQSYQHALIHTLGLVNK